MIFLVIVMTDQPFISNTENSTCVQFEFGRNTEPPEVTIRFVGKTGKKRRIAYDTKTGYARIIRKFMDPKGMKIKVKA